MRTWELVWEGSLPPNMNGSDSPFRRRTGRRLWRANAEVLAVQHALPRREILRFRIGGTILRRNLNVADTDGDVSRFKSVVDGLVAGLYLPDDNRRYCEWGEVDERHGPPGFILRIEELPADEQTARLARKRYARHDDADPLELLRRQSRRQRAPAAPRRQAIPGGGQARRAARGHRVPGIGSDL